MASDQPINISNQSFMIVDQDGCLNFSPTINDMDDLDNQINMSPIPIIDVSPMVYIPPICILDVLVMQDNELVYQVNIG